MKTKEETIRELNERLSGVKSFQELHELKKDIYTNRDYCLQLRVTKLDVNEVIADIRRLRDALEVVAY